MAFQIVNILMPLFNLWQRPFKSLSEECPFKKQIR
jgi:hypothetical protein